MDLLLVSRQADTAAWHLRQVLRNLLELRRELR
jgi:hypothetical protein